MSKAEVVYLRFFIYNMAFRIGSGVDYHQLAEGRKLFIGGVEIPHHKGALGHSDADVLLHAICDAMLGALALGDIGTHFPDTSAAFKDIDSKILLQQSFDKIKEKGYKVFVGEENLKGGNNWFDELGFAITNCKIFVPIITSSYGLTK